MAQRQRKPIFPARRRADCNGSSRMAGGLWGEWFINMFVSELPPPLNVGAMLIAWCSDIWKPPSGGQNRTSFLRQDFQNIWSGHTYSIEMKTLKTEEGGFLPPAITWWACQKCVMPSLVKEKRRQASARSVPLIFISPEVNEFNIRFNTGLLFSSFFFFSRRLAQHHLWNP